MKTQARNPATFHLWRGPAPIHTGAFLIWLGLAFVYTSVAVFAITLVYAISAYLFHTRGEEKMMLGRHSDH